MLGIAYKVIWPLSLLFFRLLQWITFATHICLWGWITELFPRTLPGNVSTEKPATFCGSGIFFYLEETLLHVVSYRKILSECCSSLIFPFLCQAMRCVCLSSNFSDLQNQLVPLKCNYSCNNSVLLTEECGGEWTFNVFMTGSCVNIYICKCFSLYDINHEIGVQFCMNTFDHVISIFFNAYEYNILVLILFLKNQWKIL